MKQLEAAIIASPDDLGPRMVYGDWLQAQGDPRGEYVALMAALTPTDLRLRSAAIEFLGKHREAILGPGAALLDAAYLGWFGGFVDEIRIQPGEHITADLAVALLSHPTCRFARHVALGRIPEIERSFECLARLPLLSSLVVHDTYNVGGLIDGNTLAKLGALRRLSLSGVAITEELPQLESLVIVSAGSIPHCPRLTELTLLFPYDYLAIDPAMIMEAVHRTPGLRKLRVVGGTGVDELVAQLVKTAITLDLLDLSHSDLGNDGLAALRSWPGLHEIIALGTSVSRRASNSDPKITGPWVGVFDVQDVKPTTWFNYRLLHEGRDVIRELPGAGVALYNAGTYMLADDIKHARAAIPSLEVSATLPQRECGTYQFSNAAIAHELALQLEEACLRAREALLHIPGEPNFHSILIDALRRTGQLEAAAAALPAAIAALAKPPRNRHAGGEHACLLDVMLTLLQLARHAEVVALAKQFPKLVTGKNPAGVGVNATGPGECQACIAIALTALGRHADARRALVRTKLAVRPVLHHARAVVALAAGDPITARTEAAKAKKAKYTELGLLETDLARLRAKPRAPRKPRNSRASARPKSKRR